METKSNNSTPSKLTYRMARNFRGLKILQFSWIRHKPQKFYPQKFCPKIDLITRTAHTHAVRGATCQHMTFSHS